ncbi:MAG: hypothetical protein Q4E88_04035 [Coriobacteriia bacterium]|nr:hypothetical protein [Coriobacteriia bacterium]
MKSFKGKLAILVSVLSVIFCFCLFFGANQNAEDNQPQTNEQESSVEQQPAPTIAKALPQSAEEVFNAIPSKETLDNLPGYINKSIELLDNESAQNTNISSNNDPKDTSPSFLNIFRDGEVHKIYACLKKTDDTFKLVLTADEPSTAIYEHFYVINDTDTGVPGYCKDYSTKISSVEIDQSVENFHPISTVQWFGSYIESSSHFDYSKLTSISGLRYLKMDKVKNSAFMFSGTKNLTQLESDDIEYIKNETNYLGELINASGMFIESGLDSDTLDMFLTKFSKSNGFKSCQYTFALCNNFKKISSEDISLYFVKNASSMFSRSGLESFDNNIKFGMQNNPNIYAITAIFYECHNLKNVDVSDMFNYGTAYYTVMDGSVVVDKVSSAVSAFQSCEKLTYVDLGKWDVSNKEGGVHLNYTTDMFSGCSSLTTIATRYDANWFDFVKDSSNMFAGCKSLVGQNRTTYKDANIHVGFAHIDEGKTNPGYFTLSKNSPEPPRDKEVIYSLGDTTQNGVFYFPVCDSTHQLPTDLVFYDINKDKIIPSNGSYYAMSDLKEAKYFSGSSSFPAIRAIHNVHWDTVYSENGVVREDFAGKLEKNEQVFMFEGSLSSPPEPKYNGVSLSSIWLTYKDLLGDANFWSKDKIQSTDHEAYGYNASNNEFWLEYSDKNHEIPIVKTLDPRDMEPIEVDASSVFLDYDDSIVDKVINATGDKIYPKNIKIEYISENFKFKVVMKDGVSVPRAFDGINELKDDNGVFTIDNRYGTHNIYIDKQINFEINFEKDQHVLAVTDKDGQDINNTGKAILNKDFVFKVKYSEKQPYVIKEVKVGDSVIEPDHDNCYIIKNVTNNKKVQITSQEAKSLTILQDGNHYFYHPIFNFLSSNSVKFYNKEGKFIWPSANNGRDYVMADLKDVRSFIGSGYKFQSIRFDDKSWDNAFSETADNRATRYKGALVLGDYCASLSFDKDKNKPLIDNIYIGDILQSYEFDNNKFWGPDLAGELEAYMYSYDQSGKSGEWTPASTNETHSIVIQHEFSDYYNIKFEGDTGVKQIVDENGNDISNGVSVSKNNNDFKFKIKCFDDRGTETVQQLEVSINGYEYEPLDLKLDNNALMFTINNIKHVDTTSCIIKINTILVNSFNTDCGLYHPIFDTELSTLYGFYDNDGQCLSATHYFPGDDADSYDMEDVTYATKYKIKSKDISGIFAARTINEPVWNNVFEFPFDGTRAIHLMDKFLARLSHTGADNVLFGDYTKNLQLKSFDGCTIDVSRIYYAYHATGFGQDNACFWTDGATDLRTCHYHVFEDSYKETDKQIDPYDEAVDGGCSVVVYSFFGKTEQESTIEFHKDEGVNRITDINGDEVPSSLTVDKGSSYQFRIEYKDGYVENQTKDGAVILNCDRENNLYTVSNIESKRVVEATSKKANTLKCSDTSKHPGLSYKPIFNKLSVNDVKFYDQNGHFMQPSQDNGTNYIMDDLKNNVAYFINNGSYNFKAVLITQHTWDEAFGQVTKGKATNYIAGDNEVFEECANLNFDKDQIPFIDDVKLSDIQKNYFENDSFYWGNYAQNDKASRYSIITTEFWEDVSRNTNGLIVLSRTYKDTYTINFNKGMGVKNFVDDKGQEIGDSIDVTHGSTLKFKPVYYPGFGYKELTVNGQSIKADKDGFYCLDNFSINTSIDAQSRIIQSLYVGNQLYHPVFQNLSSADIQFYDASGNLLPATGGEVPGPEYPKNYIMSDLINATQYICLKPDLSFTAVRSIREDKWDDVFDRKDRHDGEVTDLNQNFKKKLVDDKDNVCFFKNGDNFPLIDDVELIRVYETYNKVGFGIPDKFQFWTNTFYCSHEPNVQFCAYYMNGYHDEGDYTNVSYQNTLTDFSVSDGCTAVVSRQFNQSQTINFEKSDGIKSFIDTSGKELGTSIQNPRSTDFKFRVLCNDNFGLNEVYLNGQLLESDQDGVYTINSAFMDIKITTSCDKTLSLLRDGELYHPIFDKAYFDDIKFYDTNGNICKGDSKDTFTMSDIKSATQYVCSKDYKFKAIIAKSQSWIDAFGDDVKDRATKYLPKMGNLEQCSTLSFVSNAGDLYIEDFDQNNILVKDIRDAYLKDTKSFWTSECSANNAWLYSVNDANTDWDFALHSKFENSTILLESVFTGGYNKVDFKVDDNVEKVTDTNGNEFLGSLDFPAGLDLKFKVVVKNGYLANDVYVNNEKILPNNDGVYVLQHVSNNINININTDEAHSLISGGELFHPVCSYIPSDKVKFYDIHSNYVHASGNNGLSYLMSDLQNATQFISKDYTFEAVAARDQLWKTAFGELEGSGIAPKYLPRIESDQTCASLKFDELNSNLYISGVSVNNIVEVYFSSSQCWSPISQDTDEAYYYDNNQWIKDSKINTHTILIQKTFSSTKTTRVNFEKDEGVVYLEDSSGQKISDYVDIVPGQDLKFKINYKTNFVINSIKFNNEDLLFVRDGYFHILMDSSLIGKSSKVDIKTQKAHSLTVDNIMYKPVYESLSINDYKFYDSNGNYITPSNGDDYVMSDLANADKFIYQQQGSYELNTVGIINHTWDDAFGNGTQGKATQYKAGDVDSSIQCSTLTFNKDKDPTVDGISLTKIKELFPGVKEFWGNEANGDKAWSYQCDTGGEFDSWLYGSARTEILPILMNKKFTSSSTILFIKDDGIEDFINEDGSPLSSSYTMQSDNKLRFKVASKDTFGLESLMINGKLVFVAPDGYCTIENVNSFKLIEAKSGINIKFSKDDHIEKFVDTNGRQLPENIGIKKGNDFRFKVVCEQDYNNEFIMINNLPAIKDSDGLYTIKNIVGATSVVASSYPVKHSLKIGNDLYHPVFDKLSNEKITFYDKDDNRLPATGEAVPEREGYKYYLMTDVINATYYILSDSSVSFSAVRSSVRCDWTYPFDNNIDICTDVTDNFKNKRFNKGDFAYIFNSKEKKVIDKPKICGIELTTLYKIYNKVGFGLDVGGHFWVNWQESYYNTRYWDCANDELSDTLNKWDNPSDVVIIREFSNKINFQKDEGVKELVDINGATITSPIHVGYDKHLRFKVVCQDGFKCKQVTFNGYELTPDEDGYYTFIGQQAIGVDSPTVIVKSEKLT